MRLEVHDEISRRRFAIQVECPDPPFVRPAEVNEPELAPMLAFDIPVPLGRRDDSSQLFLERKAVFGTGGQLLLELR